MDARDGDGQRNMQSILEWQVHWCRETSMYRPGANEFPLPHATAIYVRVMRKEPVVPLQCVRPQSTRIKTFVFMSTMRHRLSECRECVAHKFALAGRLKRPWP